MSHAPPAPRQQAGLQTSFPSLSLNTSVMRPWLHSNDGLRESDLLGLEHVPSSPGYGQGSEMNKKVGGHCSEGPREHPGAASECPHATEDTDKRRRLCLRGLSFTLSDAAVWVP